VNHTNRYRRPRRRGGLALIPLTSIVALLAACSSQSSPSSPSVPTASATTGAQCADFAAGVPQAVTNTQGTDTSTVDVNWQPPKPGCARATRYDIVQIAPDGSPDGVLQAVPASTLSVTVSGLNVCTYYRFGVEAASSGGFISAIGLPSQPAFTYGPPPNANIVTIMVQGVSSHGDSATWDPLTTPVCTSSQGVYPLDHRQASPPFPASLSDLISAWMNLDDDHRLEHMPPGIGAGNNLIDSLGTDGGIVLPFSYTSPGATLDQANSFTFPGYTPNDVATSSPISIQPSNLENEIRSVHRSLPDAKIFVVGHSNGGLIAEQWWWRFGRHNHEGVVQVISLDAPLNGLYDAAYCYLVGAANGVSGFKAPCGKALADAYGYLWAYQNVFDPQKIAADNSDKLFTAVGTYGDPLFDVGDNNATTIPTDARIGIITQLFFTEPSCDSGINKFDLNTDRCQPAGRYFIDPCSSKSVPLDHQWGPPGIPPGYGAPGSIWMHSVVKNCPGVIKEVLSFYPQTTTKPMASPSTTSSCTSQAFLNVVKGSGPIQPTISGPPTCVDGYALQLFTAGPGGQAAQFFFKKAQNGSWTLIEGGDAIPTIACRVIPANVLTKLGAQCPSAAYAPSSPPTSTASKCSSAVFLKLMLTQGATFTGVSGPAKCLDGYAEQNFTFPKGPTSNYPTYFFQSDGHGGWTVLGGGAIGDVTSVCSSLPANVRNAFTLPAAADSGCPAG